MKTGILILAAKVGPKVLSLLGKALSAKGVLAAATTASFAVVFTWHFAILLAVIIAVHESGHVWAMKKSGIKTKGFYFIPFLGGVAIQESHARSQGVNSFIALAGPVWGLFTVPVFFLSYLMTGDVTWLAGIGWAGLLTVFNLLPVNPLDGGKIVLSIVSSLASSRAMVIMGTCVLVAFIASLRLDMGLITYLTFAGMLELEGAYLRMGIPKMGKREVLASSGLYILLAIVSLLLVYAVSHVPGAMLAAYIIIDEPQVRTTDISVADYVVRFIGTLIIIALGLMAASAAFAEDILNTQRTIRIIIVAMCIVALAVYIPEWFLGSYWLRDLSI